MRIYPIIFALLFVVSSCTLENTLEDSESNLQKETTNNLNKTVISEDLHLSLQYLAYYTAKLLKDPDVQNEISAYLTNTGGYTIPTKTIFNSPSQLPLLKASLIASVEGCHVPTPESHHHRPHFGGGGKSTSVNFLWDCEEQYLNSILYNELVNNNTTELYLPNRLGNLEIRSSTSSPNLSLLRQNEGYRFFNNDELAEYYFNIEYMGEGITYLDYNPMRINTANNYIPGKETKVIARIVSKTK